MLKVADIQADQEIRVEYNDGTMALFSREELADILRAAKTDTLELQLSTSQFDAAAEAALQLNVGMDSFIETAVIEKLMQKR